MEKWWNNTDRGGPKYLEKILRQCHFGHHKSHMDILGFGDTPGTNRPSRGTALKHENQLNYVLTFSLYRAVITRRLDYSNHSVHAV